MAVGFTRHTSGCTNSSWTSIESSTYICSSPCSEAQCSTALWFQIVKTRHKIISLDYFMSYFMSFSNLISANLQPFPFPGDEFYTQNLSNWCRCKYDSSISRIFFISFLADFWHLESLFTVAADFQRMLNKNQRRRRAARTLLGYSRTEHTATLETQIAFSLALNGFSQITN